MAREAGRRTESLLFIIFLPGFLLSSLLITSILLQSLTRVPSVRAPSAKKQKEPQARGFWALLQLTTNIFASCLI